VLRRFSERPLRLPRLRPFVPAPTDPRIYWFNSERDDIVFEVVRRLVDRYADDERALELVLNETAYDEVRRLERQRDAEAAELLGQWRGLIRRVGRMSSQGKVETLREIVERMTRDIAGNFDPRVYGFASRVLPGVLTAVMKPSTLGRLVDLQNARVDDLLVTQGPIAKLRRLAELGTLVLVPTHSSNLDSAAIGFTLFREALPPVVYGAGKNLFTNPIISLLMHNLGAYRVDRRVQARLYKDVLKTYSTVMLERGYHSLFFPGGKRSRSGAVESRLKLGLAGTALEAFSRNRVRGVRRPMFFVPATINYDLVLEAETLIDDQLKDAGQARYIIEDDEFTRLDRWVAFFNKLAGTQAGCIIRFGDAIDPFGNPIDDEGRSIAPNGRPIDPGCYVERDGVPVLDPARDAAYTRELGTVVAEHYRRETVIMPTQLVAHVLFRRALQATPGVDLFDRVRLRGEVVGTLDEVLVDLGTTRDRLIDLERRKVVRVSPFGHEADPLGLLQRAIAIWNGYHSRPVARATDGEVVAEDLRLLLFYQNRLVPFAERLADDAQRAAALEITNLEAVL
jgi:glycerol-3-phosphate O-acyltransferase